MSSYVVTITETTVRTYVVSPAGDEERALADALRYSQFQSIDLEGNVTEHIAKDRVIEVRERLK